MVGTREYGASKRGSWGAVIGMAIGALVLPPFGLAPGVFAGAVSASSRQAKTGPKPSARPGGFSLG